MRYEAKLGLSSVPIVVGELEGSSGEYLDGTIRLNWRLILAPVRIQDYVIVHEMAHSVHDDHSDAFWNTVGTLSPTIRTGGNGFVLTATRSQSKLERSLHGRY
ncbi:M48 family metallopeptidase [Natronosalvus rutilus]|uniref:M48 family metallopeptidase n=1 Tax=Natronosalvus rutilus TaxID=2953753 RepID=A0A9E7SUW0_9EURY|nr:M48 family metallopeptidase [Natronosalvus rutilus]UTF53262.1 M48 family metallopeptidase [Natronosalvus rutilus]